MDRKAQLGFIASIAPWAKMSQEKHGIPASIVMAQAILESAWGQSLLAAKYNNFFGIRDSRLSNDGYVELRTQEYDGLKTKQIVARFESFNDPQRCFDAHARLLANSPRYRPAMADADDPFVFAARLRECGYSTDPNYAAKLAELITVFRLREYDAKGEKAQGAG